MKKSYLMLAAAAALFAACSNDDGVAEAQNAEQQVAAGEVPVGFDVYVSRATTRGGTTGDVTTTALTTGGMKDVGFGVFAYHTNTNTYDQTFVPNFMYNQQVKHPDTKWTYSPIKYWPNEFGSGALSDEVDKVSFFAYAPYLAVTPASGKVSTDNDWGIVGMKSNSATGDPMVKYMASFYTDKQVDLVWGTAGESGNVTWNKKNSGSQTITEGMPWLDVEHPNTTTDADQTVKFQFLHSLAKVNVTVDTKAEGTDVAALAEPTITKVFIRSVTFEGFEMKGALNLNNAVASTPLWFNFDCANELNNGGEVTIKDGRTDGKEGVSVASREFVAINPDFIQSGVWTALTSVPGVNGTVGNLFCKADKTAADNLADAIYVIPNGDPLKVTIEYDVLTKDDNLNGKLNDGTTKGSVVKNVITRYITQGATASGSTTTPASFDDGNGNGIKLAPGKSYTIKLHLGLNSVEFDAAVTDWVTVTGGADLPHNVAP